MKLLHLTILIVALLAISVDCARKKKPSSSRDERRDKEDATSKQIDETESILSARREDTSKSRDNKKKEKEELPLKKAEDESSSEEEDEDKKEEKGETTTILPKYRSRRDTWPSGQDLAMDDLERLWMNIDLHQYIEYKLEQDEDVKEEMEEGFRDLFDVLAAEQELFLEEDKRRRRSPHRHSSSEEDSLPKAYELNGGVQQPLDARPYQDAMPSGTPKKAHKRRHARDLGLPKPGNTFDERDEEEWKIVNEEDYDLAGNY